MITQFSIFKNTKKEKETQPDYLLSAKVGETYVEIGSAWVKEGKTGKYFSVSLKKPYQNKPGFHIEVDVPETKVEDATSPF